MTAVDVSSPTGNASVHRHVRRDAAALAPARPRGARSAAANPHWTRSAVRTPSRQDRVWLDTLRDCSRGERPASQSVSDLYALLVRMARAQAYRMGPRWGLWGRELDDIAHHAAADAMLALAAKVETFRGEASFATWAFPFVRLAVLNSLSRGPWSKAPAFPMVLDDEGLGGLAAHRGAGLRDPAGEAEARDLLQAVRDALVHTLTPRQRQVLAAVVFEHVSVEDLADRMNMTCNSVYKCVFDARRKLRVELGRRGFLAGMPEDLR
jgi:RNA polymerase sigma-70 factor (ECF subfamily)